VPGKNNSITFSDAVAAAQGKQNDVRHNCHFTGHRPQRVRVALSFILAPLQSAELEGQTFLLAFAYFAVHVMSL
jgi:hypothetical protein